MRARGHGLQARHSLFPLAGKLFDDTRDRLTPSHTKKKTGQRLRYYVSQRFIQHSGQKDLSGWRLPAPMLEQNKKLQKELDHLYERLKTTMESYDDGMWQGAF